jgi:transcriptional regulator of arginine metabolism
MPRDYTEQKSRHATIVQILTAHNISSQVELAKMLKEKNFNVTQSSVSRDLKDLKITKVDGFYRFTANPIVDNSSINEIKEHIKQVNHAGPNILLLKTSVGAAQRVATIIDHLSLSEVIGTISGDDTIFIATKNLTDQKIISQRLEIS